MLGTYQTGEFIFQCPIFLPFHTVRGALKARILEWFAIPSSTGPHSVRTVHRDLSTVTCPPRVALHSMAHSFTEFGAAVGRVASWGGYILSVRVSSCCLVSIFQLLLCSLCSWSTGLHILIYVNVAKELLSHWVSSAGKESACDAGSPVRFLGWEDLLEKG